MKPIYHQNSVVQSRIYSLLTHGRYSQPIPVLGQITSKELETLLANASSSTSENLAHLSEQNSRD